MRFWKGLAGLAVVAAVVVAGITILNKERNPRVHKTADFYGEDWIAWDTETPDLGVCSVCKRVDRKIDKNGVCTVCNVA